MGWEVVEFGSAQNEGLKAELCGKDKLSLQPSKGFENRKTVLSCTLGGQGLGHSLNKLLAVSGLAPAAGSGQLVGGERRRGVYTTAAKVVSARKGGHNATPALQTLVQETCWHQCVLSGTHPPALGSALPRRLQLGPDLHSGPGRLLPTGEMAGQEKMPYSKPTSAGS